MREALERARIVQAQIEKEKAAARLAELEGAVKAEQAAKEARRIAEEAARAAAALAEARQAGRAKICVECREEFVLKGEEVNFYVRSQLSIPKRCAACRANRRWRREQGWKAGGCPGRRPGCQGHNPDGPCAHDDVRGADLQAADREEEAESGPR